MYRTLANLQGVLIDAIFEACIDHDLAYSVEWRKYCGVGDGTGRENKKKQAQDKVKLWYNQDCTQDEADAICIGKYFVSILKKNKNLLRHHSNEQPYPFFGVVHSLTRYTMLMYGMPAWCSRPISQVRLLE